MKKIIFALLAVLLLVSACSNETSQESLSSAEDLGYIGDMDKEFENSETDSLDEDMDLNWM